MIDPIKEMIIDHFQSAIVSFEKVGRPRLEWTHVKLSNSPWISYKLSNGSELKVTVYDGNSTYCLDLHDPKTADNLINMMVECQKIATLSSNIDKLFSFKAFWLTIIASNIILTTYLTFCFKMSSLLPLSTTLSGTFASAIVLGIIYDTCGKIINKITTEHLEKM